MALINAKAFLFSFSGLFRLECFIFASFEARYYPHLSERTSHTLTLRHNIVTIAILEMFRHVFKTDTSSQLVQPQFQKKKTKKKKKEREREMKKNLSCLQNRINLTLKEKVKTERTVKKDG